MTGSGANAPMGQAAHAPPQAHDLPGGGERHDNTPAGGVRPRTGLGCPGFRLNRRVSSAPVCARAARCRKASVAAQNRALGVRSPGRPAQLPAALSLGGNPAHRRPGSTSLSVITPALGSRANSRRSALPGARPGWSSRRARTNVLPRRAPAQGACSRSLACAWLTSWVPMSVRAHQGYAGEPQMPMTVPGAFRWSGLN
jgi:hypothetical protein